MSRVPDQHHIARIARIAHHFQVHLRDQRAGGVEYLEAAPLRLDFDGAGHAVGRKDHRGTIRNLGQLLDEACTQPAQTIHDMTVVHHFVPHVYGRAEQLYGALHDVDGAVHAGAETPRAGQKYLHAHDACSPCARFLRRTSSNASSRISPAPTVMQLSATLNAGNQCSSQWTAMKSTT